MGKSIIDRDKNGSNKNTDKDRRKVNGDGKRRKFGLSTQEETGV